MIDVLAGVNGAGKSSIGGSAIRAAGQDWFNPDEVARLQQFEHSDRSIKDINASVWQEGVQRLQFAIRNDQHFAFETTLGGRTITDTLLDAISLGVRVNIWYCGLQGVNLHIQRVKERLTRGGHDIPEALIHARYRSSMRNLCRLAPGAHSLGVYDNSAPLDKHGRPMVRQLLQMVDRDITVLDPDMPDWAKPVASVCLELANSRN